MQGDLIMAYEFSGRWRITVVENGFEGAARVVGVPNDTTRLVTVGQSVIIDHPAWRLEVMRPDNTVVNYSDLRSLFERPDGHVRIIRGSGDPLFDDFTADDPKIMLRCVDQDPIFNNPPYLGRRGLHFTVTSLRPADRGEGEHQDRPGHTRPPPPDHPPR